MADEGDVPRKQMDAPQSESLEYASAKGALPAPAQVLIHVSDSELGSVSERNFDLADRVHYSQILSLALAMYAHIGSTLTTNTHSRMHACSHYHWS